MQSHQDSFGSDALKNRGHRRSETLGKAMPITSLLLNYTPSSLQSSENIRSDAGGRVGRGPVSPTQLEKPPVFFSVHDTSPGLDGSRTTTLEHDTDDDVDLLEQDYEILISECSSSYGGSHQEDDGDRRKSHSDEYISLIGNSTFYTPCQTCVGSAPSDLAARPLAINEMCRRLCTEECRLRLSLAGLVPSSDVIGKNRAELEKYVQGTIIEDTPPKLPPRPIRESDLNAKAMEKTPPQVPKRPAPATIAIQRKQFLTDILVQNSNYHDMFSSDDDEEAAAAATTSPKNRPPNELLEIVASIVVPPPTPSVSPLPIHERNTDEASKESEGSSDGIVVPRSIVVDPHELALLKDFREKFEIAEALAKTSAMTSTTQIKQRLAARKREIELENANAISSADEHEHEHESNTNINENDEPAAAGFRSIAGDGGTKTGPRQQTVPATNDAVTNAATATTPANNYTNNSNSIGGSGANLTQRHPDTGSGDDYEPPRELLLYLVR